MPVDMVTSVTIIRKKENFHKFFDQKKIAIFNLDPFAIQKTAHLMVEITH